MFFHPNWDSRSVKEYDEQTLQRFQYNSYSVSHYLLVALRKYKYLTDGSYNSIGVYLSFNDQAFNYDRVAWKSLHDLHCSIIVTKVKFEEYLQETDIERRYEFYLSCLEQGYHYINTHKKIPKDLLLNLHDEFRKSGYKNEILFKQLCYKSLGIKVVFTKVLTTFDFHLVINAYDSKTGEVRAEGTIFRTAPDDIFYEYLIKKVQVIEGSIVILDFLAQPSFIIDIPAFARGVFWLSMRGLCLMKKNSCGKTS